jgi:hypothetical protein
MKLAYVWLALILAACSGTFDKCGQNPGGPDGELVFTGPNADRDRQALEARWNKWAWCEQAKKGRRRTGREMRG